MIFECTYTYWHTNAFIVVYFPRYLGGMFLTPCEIFTAVLNDEFSLTSVGLQVSLDPLYTSRYSCWFLQNRGLDGFNYDFLFLQARMKFYFIYLSFSDRTVYIIVTFSFFYFANSLSIYRYFTRTFLSWIFAPRNGN